MKAWPVALLLLIPAQCLATNVRGRVDFALGTGMVPMRGAAVDLCNAAGACQRFVTGPDGMFYFSAGPGNYSVRVNGVPRFQTAVPNLPYIDLPPLRGN